MEIDNATLYKYTNHTYLRSTCVLVEHKTRPLPAPLAWVTLRPRRDNPNLEDFQRQQAPEGWTLETGASLVATSSF